MPGCLAAALTYWLLASVLATIRPLAEDKRTLVIVIHEMRFTRDVANRTIFIDKGVIVEQGPAQALFRDPQQARARQFLSKFIDGRADVLR